MKRWYALGVSVLVVGGLATPSLVEARGGGGGGGGFGGGGGSFRGGGGGGGGGSYRFSAPPMEAAPRIAPAPVERAAPVVDREAQGSAGGWADRPADRNLVQGYRGSSHLYGAGSRSSWTGHNISPDQFNRLNKGGWNNDRIGNQFDNDHFNRQVNLENNFYNRNYGDWNRS